MNKPGYNKTVLYLLPILICQVHHEKLYQSEKLLCLLDPLVILQRLAILADSSLQLLQLTNKNGLRMPWGKNEFHLHHSK